MKVLENWMLDVDILPGSSQAELKNQATAQLGQAGEQVQGQIKEQAANIYGKLPEEQRGWLKGGEFCAFLCEDGGGGSLVSGDAEKGKKSRGMVWIGKGRAWKVECAAARVRGYRRG